jgi:hypothetical protein
MEENTSRKIFTQRLDIHGQALAIYVVLLVVFLVFYGSVDSGEYHIKLFSPLIILMLGIVVISSIMLIVTAIKRKQIITDGDLIEIKNRFHSKKFYISNIQRMHISNSPSKLIKGEAGFVRIKLKNRKKIIFIRTASFNDDKELLNFFLEIKNSLNIK